MADLEVKIRRLKLDISTGEMLSKMDADKIDESKIPLHFQNHPTTQK